MSVTFINVQDPPYNAVGDYVDSTIRVQITRPRSTRRSRPRSTRRQVELAACSCLPASRRPCSAKQGTCPGFKPCRQTVASRLSTWVGQEEPSHRRTAWSGGGNQERRSDSSGAWRFYHLLGDLCWSDQENHRGGHQARRARNVDCRSKRRCTRECAVVKGNALNRYDPPRPVRTNGDGSRLNAAEFAAVCLMAFAAAALRR